MLLERVKFGQLKKEDSKLIADIIKFNL